MRRPRRPPPVVTSSSPRSASSSSSQCRRSRIPFSLSQVLFFLLLSHLLPTPAAATPTFGAASFGRAVSTTTPVAALLLIALVTSLTLIVTALFECMPPALRPLSLLPGVVAAVYVLLLFGAFVSSLGDRLDKLTAAAARPLPARLPSRVWPVITNARRGTVFGVGVAGAVAAVLLALLLLVANPVLRMLFGKKQRKGERRALDASVAAGDGSDLASPYVSSARGVDDGESGDDSDLRAAAVGGPSAEGVVEEDKDREEAVGVERGAGQRASRSSAVGVPVDGRRRDGGVSAADEWERIVDEDGPVKGYSKFIRTYPGGFIGTTVLFVLMSFVLGFGVHIVRQAKFVSARQAIRRFDPASLAGMGEDGVLADKLSITRLQDMQMVVCGFVPTALFPDGVPKITPGVIDTGGQNRNGGNTPAGPGTGGGKQDGTGGGNGEGGMNGNGTAGPKEQSPSRGVSRFTGDGNVAVPVPAAVASGGRQSTASEEAPPSDVPLSGRQGMHASVDRQADSGSGVPRTIPANFPSGPSANLPVPSGFPAPPSTGTGGGTPPSAPSGGPTAGGDAPSPSGLPVPPGGGTIPAGAPAGGAGSVALPRPSPNSTEPGRCFPPPVPFLDVDDCAVARGNTSAGIAICFSGLDKSGRPRIPLSDIITRARQGRDGVDPVLSTMGGTIAARGFGIATLITAFVAPVLWLVVVYVFRCPSAVTLLAVGLVCVVPLLITLLSVNSRLVSGAVREVVTSASRRSRNRAVSVDPLSVYFILADGLVSRELLHVSGALLLATIGPLMVDALVHPKDLARGIGRVSRFIQY